MDVATAIRQRRSIRQFQQRPVDVELLIEMVSLARLHTSAGNRQPIRYAIIAAHMRDVVFSHLRWAAYLPEYKVLPDKRPGAYILIMANQEAGRYSLFEAGAAATNLMLAAQEMGLSSCCLGIANQRELCQSLMLPEKQEIIAAIAIGYPACNSRIVPFIDSVRYYQDDNGDFCVPKLDAKELIIYSDMSK